MSLLHAVPLPSPSAPRRCRRPRLRRRPRRRCRRYRRCRRALVVALAKFVATIFEINA